jgi:hypothetical protein
MARATQQQTDFTNKIKCLGDLSTSEDVEHVSLSHETSLGPAIFEKTGRHCQSLRWPM